MSQENENNFRKCERKYRNEIMVEINGIWILGCRQRKQNESEEEKRKDGGAAGKSEKKK